MDDFQLIEKKNTSLMTCRGHQVCLNKIRVKTVQRILCCIPEIKEIYCNRPPLEENFQSPLEFKTKILYWLKIGLRLKSKYKYKKEVNETLDKMDLLQESSSIRDEFLRRPLRRSFITGFLVTLGTFKSWHLWTL